MATKKVRPLASLLQEFDPRDPSWWEFREMGSPDDPYNNIPKLSPEDPLYKEYVDIAENGFETILKEYESDEDWVFCKEEEVGHTIFNK